MPFIGPWEIALIIIVVLIIFGPKKLPELAKSIGSAIRQYKQATEGFLGETETVPYQPSPKAVESKDERLILLETAKKLGIQTEGKTPEEISEEIVRRTQTKRARRSRKPVESGGEAR
jgi:sec-independent protein translocase protein TatA